MIKCAARLPPADTPIFRPIPPQRRFREGVTNIVIPERYRFGFADPSRGNVDCDVRCGSETAAHTRSVQKAPDELPFQRWRDSAWRRADQLLSDTRWSAGELRLNNDTSWYIAVAVASMACAVRSSGNQHVKYC